MHHFTYTEALPGVYHIQDMMGVCMTLLVGEEQALLVDAGYGLEDVSAFVRTLTDKPVTLVLTHAHHDHALGARWFDKALMFPQERAVYDTYTREPYVTRVADQAAGKGLAVPADWAEGTMAAPVDLAEGPMDLGGMTAQIIPCPGHTPGSAVIYVPERQLLLTGDDWNPCTWLFFPAALPVAAYRENVRRLLALPIRHVLCSHQPHLYDRFMLEDFLQALTDDVLDAAQPVNVGYPQDTRKALLPHRQELVFDWNKFRKE